MFVLVAYIPEFDSSVSKKRLVCINNYIRTYVHLYSPFPELSTFWILIILDEVKL